MSGQKSGDKFTNRTENKFIRKKYSETKEIKTIKYLKC